ncbi:MAG: septum formation initiator family protein [Robiginitomaculum sp.]|nr:septum formation initiator family protein [Robiginitomaculum sp.]
MKKVLSKIRFTWPLLVLVVFYGYLGLHVLSGSLGMLKWADYSEQVEKLEAEITRLQDHREALEKRAAQLRDSNLDLDRLDEEARRLLSVSDANDIVIWLDETP